MIKDGKLYGKLAQQDGKIFIHFLKAQTISASSLKDIPVKCDINGSSDAKCGDVAGYVCRGYLEHLFLLDGSYKFDKDLCRVFGNIESCMDILQECCKRRTVKEITDCGLVLERG